MFFILTQPQPYHSTHFHSLPGACRHLASYHWWMELPWIFKAGERSDQIWMGQSYSGWSGKDRPEGEKVRTEKPVRRLSGRSDRRWRDFAWVIQMGWESSQVSFPYHFNLFLTILYKLRPQHHLSPSPAPFFCLMLTTIWHPGRFTYSSIYYYLSPPTRI